MVHKVRINVGTEVAKFMYRQATDPRTKGIYCGGYVTKFLKGYGIFQSNPSDHRIPTTKISDGPFPSWGMVKLVNLQTPPRGVSSPFVASASRATPPNLNEIQLLRQEFREERRKSKRFRAAVWEFLEKLASCFNPPPADLPKYQSSPEPPAAAHSEEAQSPSAESTPAQPSPVHSHADAPAAETVPESSRRKGKAPVVTVSLSSDEEDDDDADDDDSDDDEEDADSGRAGPTSSATEEDSDDAATD